MAVWVVRHCEKAAEGPRAPLTARGRARAAALARALPIERIRLVVTTAVLRTQETAAPVCAAARCEPLILDPWTPEPSIAAARPFLGEGPEDKGDALVVGHAQTVSAIVRGLGARERVVLSLEDYGDLIRVAQGSEGVVITRSRFGDDTTAETPMR